MPHELEYIVDQAVCFCDKGAKPDFFKGTSNTHVKINGCKACTKADKLPIVNIPSFGACGITGGACVPVPVDWTDTYKVKIKGQQTLLFKSKLPCSLGGKIEFMTSGQVPVSADDLDELMEEHGEEEESDDGLSWWDAAEMIPFAGGVIGMVRSGAKGDWLGFGLSAASLVLDVAGLFSFGAGNVGSAAVKTGKLARIGAKAVKAAGKVAKAGKFLKAGGKAAAKALAKKVDDIALKTGKVCVFACFPAGTLVHTISGTKKIESICVGDEVWAYDEDTGEIALQKVTALMEREVDATVLIELEGEIIETTAEHPFYTEEGWKDAADLTLSDKVQTKEGEFRAVKSQTFQYEKKKVFNFEVNRWHTYFVGLLAWLVHNAAVCIKTVIKKVSNRLKYLGRTPGKGSKTGKEVFERMQKEGTARIRRGKKEFWDPDNKKWRDIKEADMGHIEDAVKWWNRKGYKYGPKSKEVRDWMLDSKNYKYEYRGTNRSRGAQLKDTYRKPK